MNDQWLKYFAYGILICAFIVAFLYEMTRYVETYP